VISFHDHSIVVRPYTVAVKLASNRQFDWAAPSSGKPLSQRNTPLECHGEQATPEVSRFGNLSTGVEQQKSSARVSA